MSEKESLLQLLYFYPADYISAEKLGRRLGIEKSKVYKYMEELRLEGYNISGCTNRGYRLNASDDPLSPDDLIRYYPMDKNKIRIFSSLPSTNTTAKEMATCGAPEGTICIAETQTKGRGRMDRHFFSPNQTGLYMSIILRPNLAPQDALQITTLAAVAVAETIEKETEQPAQIKWVNDIYFKGKKVAGILTEASVNPATQHIEYAVLGIGVNLFMPKGNFPGEIHDIAGAVFESPLPHARCKFAAGILERFYFYYRQLEKKAFLEPYRRRSLLAGRSVSVNRHGTSYPATVLAINDDFSLHVLLSDGTTENLSTGEVSVKLS